MRAVGIILAGGNSRKMKELTSRRAAAAMPVAGSYRAIDFTLSNMTSSQEIQILINRIRSSSVPVTVIICDRRCEYI